MICSVTKDSIKKIVDFCDKDSVFACEIYSSLKAFGTGCSWVYGGFDNNGENAFCAVKTTVIGYIVYAQGLDDEKIQSLAEFFLFMPKKNIISSKNVLEKLQNLFGGEIEEKLIMKSTAKKYFGKSNDHNPPVHPKRYDHMFEVLTKAFPEDCPREMRDDWIYTTSLKERKAGAKAVSIYEDEKCVSCGFLDCVNSHCGIIASLATDENYSKKGFGTRIIKSLILCDEMINKNAYVVLLDNELEKFYEKTGFITCEKYCILKY
ncbi:MAG: GNAT family N-acetyltransferase [Oscillospiraceae bacterium]